MNTPTPGKGELGDLIARLRGLLAKAVPSPWHIEPNGWISGAEHKGRVCDYGPTYGGPDAESKATAALITEAVNSLPVLLDALDRLSAEGVGGAMTGREAFDAFHAHFSNPDRFRPWTDFDDEFHDAWNALAAEITRRAQSSNPVAGEKPAERKIK